MAPITKNGIFTIAAAVLIACSAPAASPRADHPILGAWILSAANSSCMEDDVYGSDGRRHSTSAQEISASEYSISESPSEKGYYKMVDVVVRSNGLPDCTGSVTPVGDTSTVYLRFSVGNTEFLLCTQELLSSCFVRARRAPTI